MSLFSSFNVAMESNSDISAATDRVLKQRVAESIIVDYAKHLFDEKEVTSKKDCFAVVEDIIDTLMDRGEINISSKSVIRASIDQFKHNTRLVAVESIVNSIYSNSITSSMEAITDVESPANTEEQELAKKYVEAKAVLDEATANLEGFFKNHILNCTDAFVAKNKKLFNESYIAKYNIK